MKLLKYFLFAIILPLFALTARAQSPMGNALAFNGTNQYVTITNFGTIIPTNEVTVEFWAYSSMIAVQSAFMLNPDQNTNRFNAHINYNSGPTYGNTFWDFGNISGAGRLGPIPAPANSISNWVHYAFVASQSGNYMSIYTNGVLCATKSGMTPFVRGNYSLQIGGPGFSYNGRLDEFRVWNIARSQAQIQANLGTPLTGGETNLLLYYRFDSSSGNIATNSAIATGAAYNGITTNNPAWVNAGEPFATGTVASVAYTFTTFAGGSAAGSSDGAGDGARFNGPYGIASDTNGNLYVADSGNDTIRKITSAGVVTTLAGLAGYSGSADGANSSARFNQPYGIAVDGFGNLYVADSMNSTIRKVTPTGVVSTIAGLAGNGGTADGTNGAARFNNPFGIAIDDNNGNLYVADEGNDTIRKITPMGTNWVVSTLAGKAGVNGSTDGTGTNALFNGPFALTADASGNIYVCDPPAIRKITPAGVVTTIAGSTQGTVDGVGTNAQFYSPFGIAVDSATNLYVADGNGSTIRKIAPVGTNWVVTTFAGHYVSFNQSYTDYTVDGTGTNAGFAQPYGVALDNSGNIYVTDNHQDNIRKITSAGVVTTLAGQKNSAAYLDGTGVHALFNGPSGVTLDTSGNIYVADTQNQVIRKITPAGVVSTLAGQPGVPNEQNGTGNQALFIVPYGIAADSFGNLYVTENSANTSFSGSIRKVTPAGVVTTVAGTGVPGHQDGPVTTAQFCALAGITIDTYGNLYVTEQDNKIRMISTNGIVSTIAGSPSLNSSGVAVSAYDNNGNHIGGYADGTGTNALFNFPSGIVVDTVGDLYVADSVNHVIRKIISPKLAGLSRTNPANWTVTTLAGVAGIGGTNDGTGANALFGNSYYHPGPTGVSVDNSGNLYVTDNGNNTIRKITPAGVVTTIGGLAGTVGSVDGSGNYAQFNVPAAIALDSSGGIYVADQLNNTIRKGTFTQYGSANIVSFVQPAMTSQLQVTLLPSEANGQWRFPWEVAWRNSGQTASNLVAGNYPVEFRALPGWLAIPSSLIVAVINNVSLTNQYFPTISAVDTNSGGSLTVTLGPNPPGGAGWRFLGDTTPFYLSGYSTNLIAGTYLIEFAAVSGRVKPPNLSVQVQPGLPTLLAENYLLADSPPAGVELPFAVPAANISDLADYPFGFNGELQSDSDVGYGSGVAVLPKVVLTAAHMVFNDQTLSYVSQVYWYFQREAGVFEPEPQAARGWLVLSGYAAQRTNDLEGLGGQTYGPDESSPQSRNLDVAALFFILPMAGGGYGGYLPSDASPNPWLTGNSLKMVVGYPVDGSLFGTTIVPGTMYQIQPQPYALNPDTEPEVYTAPWFLSYPGNSGGPVYVQFNGYYYPAGVYSGIINNGIYQSAVRAIDSDVVNLITNAEAKADYGTNNPGGGVITVVPSQAVSASNPGYLEFQLGPPAAVAAGAGWRLQGDTTYSSATNYIRAVFSTNAFAVEFKPIAGWNVPTNQSVTVYSGQIAVYNALYTLNNSAPVQIVSPQLSGGTFNLSFQSANGQSYTLYYNDNLATTNWLPATNVTGNGATLQLSVPANNSSQRFFRISQP
ncbi:MAG TPA: LamG-like jellyroll fold domain-containing protein [Verrucomicrobiae bacterium]|jgi:hypothetical protein